MSFAELWQSLLPIGRDPGTGGYRRYSWTPADLACREWFHVAAAERGLREECDRNGNLWAWWDAGNGAARDAGNGAAQQAVATGSHLDSVPDGGAFDGPLGVVSAFAAIDRLRKRGFAPGRPITIAAFTEEEGARFGVACLGSKLAAGAVAPSAARELRDAGGISLTEAMTAAGVDPAGLGPDDERLAGLAAYVELHVEQGRALAGLGAAVGVAESIWPHGRWLLEFTGRPDHAGTTRLADRHDPMLPYAETVLAARRAAAGHQAVATIGKVVAEPGAANGISSAVRAWLDARAPDDVTLERLVDEVSAAAQGAAAEHGVGMGMRRESFIPLVSFDSDLRDRVQAAVSADAGGTAIPILPTGAGHDAAALATRLPTAMLFVRNPTGTSHSPAEHAELADCKAGVAALAAVLADLAR